MISILVCEQWNGLIREGNVSTESISNLRYFYNLNPRLAYFWAYAACTKSLSLCGDELLSRASNESLPRCEELTEINHGWFAPLTVLPCDRNATVALSLKLH